MITQITYALFLKAFLENVLNKSSTIAEGHSSTAVSSLKLPLLLKGEELTSRVLINVINVSRIIWSERIISRPPEPIEIWHSFRIWSLGLQSGLIDYDSYKKRCSELHLNIGDYRYRIWDVKYHPENPKPEEIHQRFCSYVKELSLRIKRLENGDHDLLVDLLCFADREFDFMIHPYLDGCGRFATAIVMWLSASFSPVLPKFGTKGEHYKVMQEEDTYKAYMRRCLENGYR